MIGKTENIICSPESISDSHFFRLFDVKLSDPYNEKINDNNIAIINKFDVEFLVTINNTLQSTISRRYTLKRTIYPYTSPTIECHDKIGVTESHDAEAVICTYDEEKNVFHVYAKTMYEKSYIACMILGATNSIAIINLGNAGDSFVESIPSGAITCRYKNYAPASIPQYTGIIYIDENVEKAGYLILQANVLSDLSGGIVLYSKQSNNIKTLEINGLTAINPQYSDRQINTGLTGYYTMVRLY